MCVYIGQLKHTDNVYIYMHDLGCSYTYITDHPINAA